MSKLLLLNAREPGKDIPDWSYTAVQAMLVMLEAVDPQTHAHCLRVGFYAKKLARDLGLDHYTQHQAEFAGIMHDLGKIALKQDVLHKPSRLTDSEFAHVMEHPEHSEKILEPLCHHEFFASIRASVRGHHERFDGRGYPDRLTGDHIPEVARLLLVVDTLDAMGQDRSYRKGLPIESIYQEINKCAGSQFDASMVKVFLEAHRHWAKEPLSNTDFAQILQLDWQKVFKQVA